MRRAKLRSEVLGVMEWIECIVKRDGLLFCNKEIHPVIVFDDVGLAENGWFSGGSKKFGFLC